MAVLAPLGYLNVDGADGKKMIIPGPNLAPIIARRFERYATGRYSLRGIVKMACADGLVYRKSGNPVPTSTVHKILRNKIYCGDYTYTASRITARTSRSLRWNCGNMCKPCWMAAT